MKIAPPARVVRLLRDRLAATGDAGRTITLAALVNDVLPYPVARAALGLAGKAEYDLTLLHLLENRTYLQVDPAVVDAVAEELELPEPGLGFVDEWSDSLLRLRRIDMGPPPDDDEGPEEEEAGAAAAGGHPQPASPPDVSLAGDVERGEAGASGAPTGGPPGAGPGVAPGRPSGRESAGRAAPHAPRASATEPAVEPAEADREPRPDARAPVVREPRAHPPAPASMPTDEPPESAGDPSSVELASAAPPLCWSCGGRLPARETVLYCPQCGTGQRDRRCPGCGDRVEADWRFCVRCGRGLPRP